MRKPRLEPTGREGGAPLSYAQERMWFLNQMDPESNTYNLHNKVKVKGDLNTAALSEPKAAANSFSISWVFKSPATATTRFSET